MLAFGRTLHTTRALDTVTDMNASFSCIHIIGKRKNVYVGDRAYGAPTITTLGEHNRIFIIGMPN